MSRQLLPSHGSETVRDRTGSTSLAPTKITARVLERLRPGQRVRDTVVRGFFAEAGKAGVSLKVQADLWDGERGTRRLVRTVRHTLGRYPALSIDEGRQRAMAVLAQIKSGLDPRHAAPAPVRWTVGALFEEYVKDLAIRKRSERTASDLRKLLRLYLSDWAELPIESITRAMCRERHAHISKHNGEVAANYALRALRTCVRFALDKLDVKLPDGNPIRGVTFHERDSRRVFIPFADLPSWYAHVQALPNELRRVMHELGLFSGLRPGTLVSLERAWLRLDECAIVIPAGRMKARREFSLPMSDHMVGLVRRALALGDAMHPGSPWLFPTRSADGREVKPTQVWRERTIAERTGHIVRHTYSVACNAARVSSVDRQLLLGQKIPGVEGVYIHDRALFDHLLAEQARVTAFLLTAIQPLTVDPQVRAGNSATRAGSAAAE
jgi:integrase